MYQKNLKNYKTTQILTSDPGKVIVLLYNGAISYLEQAADHAKSGAFEKRGQLVYKVYNIILELLVSLNHEDGGEIAENLQQIYLFLSAEILEADHKNDADLLLKCRDILIPLRDAWHTVASSSALSAQSNNEMNMFSASYSATA